MTTIRLQGPGLDIEAQTGQKFATDSVGGVVVQAGIHQPKDGRESGVYLIRNVSKGASVFNTIYLDIKGGAAMEEIIVAGETYTIDLTP